MGEGFKSKKPIKQTIAKQTRKKKRKKIRNLQTDYEEKETEKGKEERTFEICNADSQNSDRNRVGVVAQMNRKKRAKVQK